MTKEELQKKFLQMPSLLTLTDEQLEMYDFWLKTERERLFAEQVKRIEQARNLLIQKQ